jgi:hypothetical protein
MPLASNANEPAIRLEPGFASSGDQPVCCEAACCPSDVRGLLARSRRTPLRGRNSSASRYRLLGIGSLK